MSDRVDRRTVLFGLLAGAGATVTGCSRGSDDATPPGPTPPPGTAAPTPTPVDTRPRWPLTGALITGKGDPAHAAVAVKVPDNRREHPQVGLDKADIVIVELDGYRDSSGYSSTRLVPVFHSRMPKGVGPVRSIRPVDVPMLAPIGTIIGSTGATGWVLKYAEDYPEFIQPSLTYMETKGTGSYSIDPARIRKYQGVTYYDRAVVCHPAVLAKQTTKFRAGPKQAYFPFAATDSEVSTVGGKPARTVRVPWKKGDTYDMGYGFDEKSGRYLRSMPWGKHVLGDGTRVATDNVLVVRATQHYGKVRSGPGGPEPIHDVIRSTGTFVYAHGGRYVTGTWAKGEVNEVFQFTLDDGSPLKMAPGQTYVELPQIDAKVRITG